MDDEKGVKLVRFARSAVETYLSTGSLPEIPTEDWLLQKSGVFVSIYTFPLKELRGCIGYPMPILPLGEATVRAAVAAASEDPRFPPVEKNELDKVIFEVSVLSQPEEMPVSNRKELHKEVVVGRDGLIIESPYGSGLLLPQVPVEYGWDAEEFLSNLCIKAGLDSTYWLYGRYKLYRFTAEVFAETNSRGRVVRVDILQKKC
ncbi:MAG: TIGR00296 family protein [Candidatus Caldarchaeum sp.]